MDNAKLTDNLSKHTGLDIKTNVLLSPYTTWKIGGPAEMLTIVNSRDEFISLVKYCLINSISFTILGKGSNVLISDKGLKGLVIINEFSEISISDKKTKILEDIYDKIIPRVNKQEYSDFDYKEDITEQVEVCLGSGTILHFAINYLICKGITGLQWFSGIPGTIGGALYNNIHGGTHFISEFVKSAVVIDKTGNVFELTKDEMKFEYDNSIFQTNQYTIIDVKLLLDIGDSKKALKASLAWSKKKVESQPFNSGGCCFKNLTNEEKELKNLPSNSWGYIIDNVLNLKGTREGDAIISNKHAAFIENLGNATSTEVLVLLNQIFTKSKKELGITPRTEIFFLGFEKNEIDHYI
jgi:UDP-N-acetylmuramate dehydrogenase